MAIYTYDITTELSDQTIYCSVLQQDALDAGLSTVTSVDARDNGSNDVRFHFPSALSGPDETTLDGVVAAYDPAGTQPILDSELELILEDVGAADNEKVAAIWTDAGTLKIGTCSDVGAASNAAIEVTRTGETIAAIALKAPVTVTGEVTASDPTVSTSLVTKSYADALAQSLEWKDSVLSVLDDPPVSSTTGDRHLVGTGTAAWAGQDDDITTSVDDGASWTFETPTKGTTLTVDTPLGYQNFNGTAWVSLGSGVSHANLLGLTTGDPHTQYLLGTTRNAVSGVAGLDGSSKLTGSQQTYGSAANTACVGNDARLSDDRDPTAHATDHSDGGTDEIKIENLGATSTDATKVFGPDGAGGVEAKAASGGGLPSYYYTANDLILGAANWPDPDPPNASVSNAINVLSFSGFTSQGAGFQMPPVPSGATSMQITLETRPAVAPSGVKTADTTLYTRDETTTEGSWSSPITLATISYPDASVDWIATTVDKTLVTWGLTVGLNYRIQIRVPTTGDIDASINLKAIRVDFT